MTPHDSRRQRFLLVGPIEEVGEDSAVRERDDDGTRELVDELEQILASGQAALPSPTDFDEYDDTPFAPRAVVAETYDPYHDTFVGDDDDDLYDEEVYDTPADDIGRGLLGAGPLQRATRAAPATAAD